MILLSLRGCACFWFYTHFSVMTLRKISPNLDNIFTEGSESLSIRRLVFPQELRFVNSGVGIEC